MAELDWKALAVASMHPFQVRILERLAANPSDRLSPSELAEEFGEPLGNASYHVRVLLAAGLLKKAGTKPRRGAIQHFYEISERALL